MCEIHNISLLHLVIVYKNKVTILTVFKLNYYKKAKNELTKTH